PPRRTLSPIITLGLAALLAAAAFALWLPSTPTSNPGNLRYPAESAARMVDRHLQFYAGIESEPTWKRRWFTLLFGTRAHVQEDAEQVYRDVLTYLDAHPERATPWALLNTRARLIVLLAELDQWPALERELAHFGELPEEAVIVDAVRFAYGPASE
ncbi:MAG: CPBP family intramembrane metalloprotease, partial [Gammaproteobacteria bacterium]|nr:CPBP family intramembrane metalloprotease [Gammaproteobacteria bacterium]